MELITIEPQGSKWDEFVNEYSNLIFHTTLWANVLKEGYKQNKLLYFVLRDNKKWLLAMPGMVLDYKFFHLFHSLIHYGGFIGQKEYIPVFLELLERELRKYKVNRIQIVDPEIKMEEYLQHQGFKTVESYRHILDLKDKSVDEIWKGYKSNLKRTIKQALKKELSFQRISTRQEVEDFYRLYLLTMKRNKAVAKYPVSLVYGIYDFMNEDTADIFLVKYQTQPIAGIIVIYSDSMAHYVQGGSDSQYLHLRANDLLFHEAIKIALAKGKRYFDFLGSDKRFLSLIQFKEKWGTRREKLFNFYKDLDFIQPLLWNLAYRFINTSLVAKTINKIRYWI